MEEDGQDDFSRPQRVQHVGTLDEALRLAATSLDGDQDVYLLNIDTGESREVSGDIESTDAMSAGRPTQRPSELETSG